MKNKYIFIVTLVILILQPDIVLTKNTATVQEQLENLNKYWENKNIDDPVLKERTPLTNDVSLIQMHLSLVEKTLRNKSVDDLSITQRQNRQSCLDILHNYWTKGVFPKNLYHNKRTPYFIDDFGTACAVGQLVISTGSADFAKKISNENNYGYIENMNAPELYTWANKYGFTIDELAWIQPTYGCVNPVCSNDTKRNVSCYGGSDGCFGAFPTSTLPNPPFMYSWYKLNSMTSTWLDQPQPCDLIAGTYKVVVINSIGSTEDFIYQITQPDSFAINTSSTNDNGSCNGTATANVSGATPPYTYLWTPSSETTPTITDRCAGCYSVQVTDNNNCVKMDSTCVDFLVGQTEINPSTSFSVYPNPANDKLFFKLTDSHLTITIYNTLGVIVLSQKLINKTADISSLENGVYFIALDNEKVIKRHKIIKNSH
jgi:hypothetical protein